MPFVFGMKSWASSRPPSFREVQGEFAKGYPASKIGLKGCWVMFTKHFPSKTFPAVKLFPRGTSAVGVTRTGVNAIVGVSMVGTVGSVLNRL